jgi:hypothetical protein
MHSNMLVSEVRPGRRGSTSAPGAARGRAASSLRCWPGVRPAPSPATHPAVILREVEEGGGGTLGCGGVLLLAFLPRLLALARCARRQPKEGDVRVASRAWAQAGRQSGGRSTTATPSCEHQAAPAHPLLPPS